MDAEYGWHTTTPEPHYWLGKRWKDYVHTAEWLELVERSADVPMSAGVYFLWDADGGLQYVGASCHVQNRVAQHIWARRIPFRYYSVIEADADIAALVEMVYICALRPVYNRTFGPVRWSGHERMARLIRRLWRHNYRTAA